MPYTFDEVRNLHAVDAFVFDNSNLWSSIETFSIDELEKLLHKFDCPVVREGIWNILYGKKVKYVARVIKEKLNNQEKQYFRDVLSLDKHTEIIWLYMALHIDE